MTDHIRVDGPGTPHSRRLRDTVDTGWSFKEQLERVFQTVEALNPGENGYGAVEELFGLGEGEGQPAYNLITGARTAVNGFDISSFLRLIS